MGAPLRAPKNIRRDPVPQPGHRITVDTDPANPPATADAEAPGYAQVRSQVLERLARGAGLDEVLELLVHGMESLAGGPIASVMLLDESGKRVRVGAAPSLPAGYREALEGLAIGPSAGSCGTAAYWGVRVIVRDIALDPRWDGYRELALGYGLRACWAEPIRGSDGRVLGTFALYYREARDPDEVDVHAIAAAADVASIAIERQRAGERIAHLTNLYRARSELSRIIVRSVDVQMLLPELCRIAVEFGGMRLAWVCGAPGTDGCLAPVACYGDGQEYLELLHVTSDPNLREGQGPTARALRNGDCVVVNEFDTSPYTAPWRDNAARFGFRSSGAFAIRRGEGVHGVLSVYSQRRHAFDPETVALLQQMAKDVSLALERADRARERQQVLEALRRSEQHFRAYFDCAIIGMAATDFTQRWIEVNEAFCAMLGYTREEMLQRSWADLTHPDDRLGNQAQWAQLQARAIEQFETEKRYIHKDGHAVHTRIAGRVVRDAPGMPDYIVLMVKDQTERYHAVDELHEKRELINSILQSEPECVQVLGLDGQLIQINEAGLAMLGARSVEEVRTAGFLSFVLPKFRRPFLELHGDVCAGGNGVLEFQVRGADGELRWLETHVTPLRDAQGKVGSVLGITRDISEKKRSAELIWKQANFDLLTGLPNRYMFQDRLAQEIKKARRSGGSVALLFIDIDFFKEINDTLGHESGDALLVAVSQRISACVRESDTVARLGGDEFTVILPLPPAAGASPGAAGAANAAEQTAQSIITRLAEGFRVREESVVLSASIGITYFPGDARSVDDLLKNADQAMYVAKRQGRNRVAFFTATLQEDAVNRLRMIHDLRGALAAGQFHVYFQPIIDLATRRIHGAEALLRWQHPTRGMVSPAEFIPLTEETGLIIDIGDWVFRESARWALRWCALAGVDFPVSVNNSPVQFRDPARLLGWIEHLHAIGLPGRNMTVEITEGLLLDADAGVTDMIQRLHANGLRVAIDDFGTGYSSLAYLHKFQIDSLKIDQSFTRNLQTQPSAQALSESIIVMAHKLGLSVVAEGVETPEQLEFLAGAGCDFAQGYLFSRPVPPEQFEALLEDALSASPGVSGP